MTVSTRRESELTKSEGQFRQTHPSAIKKPPSTTPKTRQQTLTQIDYVSRVQAHDVDLELQYLDDNDDGVRRAKRLKLMAQKQVQGKERTRNLSVNVAESKKRPYQSTDEGLNECLDSAEEFTEERDGHNGEDKDGTPNAKKSNTMIRQEQRSIISTFSVAMPPPQTPRAIRRTEVPSSQSPVDTPWSVRSRRSVGSPLSSPLKQRSTNAMNRKIWMRAPYDVVKPLKLVVHDTFDFETPESQISTPNPISEHSSSDPEQNQSLAWQDLENEAHPLGYGIGLGLASSPAAAIGTTRSEIPDSDSEGDPIEETESEVEVEYTIRDQGITPQNTLPMFPPEAFPRADHQELHEPPKEKRAPVDKAGSSGVLSLQTTMARTLGPTCCPRRSTSKAASARLTVDIDSHNQVPNSHNQVPNTSLADSSVQQDILRARFMPDPDAEAEPMLPGIQTRLMRHDDEHSHAFLASDQIDERTSPSTIEVEQSSRCETPSSHSTTLSSSPHTVRHKSARISSCSSPILDILSTSPLQHQGIPQLQKKQVKRRRATDRWDGEVLTDSQLLPESMMQFSIPKPPGWGSQESVDTNILEDEHPADARKVCEPRETDLWAGSEA